MTPQHLANADLHAEALRREKASRHDAAERLALIAEIDRRRSFEDEGFLSTTSWMRDRFRISGAEARRWVELARRLAGLAEVWQALAEGDISFDHARLLASAAVEHPDRFDEDHKVLIDNAKYLSPTSLRKALDYWRTAVEPEHFEAQQQRTYDQRRLNGPTNFRGGVHLDADFDVEGGHIVMTAVRSAAEPAALDASDPRTPSSDGPMLLSTSAAYSSTPAKRRWQAARSPTSPSPSISPPWSSAAARPASSTRPE